MAHAHEDMDNSHAHEDMDMAHEVIVRAHR
jgi:hypothetical protein